MTIKSEVDFLVEAINSLRPNAAWCTRGLTLEWMDSTQIEPTVDEIAVEIARLKDMYKNTEYQRQRMLEYPDFTIYLDGIVKENQEQIQLYIDQCLAVKNKYPKP
jgi:hypothetical protein